VGARAGVADGRDERLFDMLGRVWEVQTSLFGSGATVVDASSSVQRTMLDDRSWVDVGRDWLSGSDTFLTVLLEAAAWRQGRREMYGRILDDPRWSWSPRRAVEPSEITTIRSHLEERYGTTFGQGFCNFYRNGQDSVAFHGDRILRDSTAPSLVAIVTLGAARPFLIRPKGGGRSTDLRPGPGDLIVMGGRCQHDHEHAVPKCRRAGPRISISFRSGSLSP
jgi:alkylated DNA repair dioxygenase AlkB